MSLIDSITLLKIRGRSYILFYAGSKRMQKLYDAMAPDGTTICSSVVYDKAVAACQMHHIKTTPRPRRKSKVECNKQPQLNYSRLDHGNDYLSDKTCLADYTDWSFGESVNIQTEIKRNR